MLQCHAFSEETAVWCVVIFIVFVQLGEVDAQGENHVSGQDCTNSKNFFYITNKSGQFQNIQLKK